ncbi:MAG TPA: hypothetical protein VNM40_03450 [Candidatus Paceibacterota bacterium]|nr:hypothetical protein [Candidatus Paceibacterota bacterium]
MEETTQPQAPSSSKKWLYIGLGIVVLIIIGALMTGALGRGTGFGSAYFAPGADIDRNMDGSTTYTTEEGSVTVGSNTMPSNWPSDAPTAYSGAQISYAGTSNPQTGEAGSAVIYTVQASVESVVEYYESRLRAEGWTITATAEAGGMRMITATKDTRVFGAYIGSDGQGNTSVTAGLQL